MDQADAEREFLKLRRALFPDWQQGDEWSVVLGPHPDHPEVIGACSPLLLRLYVPQRSNRLEWRAILAHEICHAISGTTDHGPAFQRQLEAAIRGANAQGMGDLASTMRRRLGHESAH
jgi:hypothetical protein